MGNNSTVLKFNRAMVSDKDVVPLIYGDLSSYCWEFENIRRCLCLPEIMRSTAFWVNGEERKLINPNIS